jgi:hypothetical protein
MVILDPELKALMAKDRSVAVLWQDAEEEWTALLAKAPDQDVASFRGRVAVQTRWELGRFACGSVLRLRLMIFDQPDNPYRFETFINVADLEQLACVLKLMTQEILQVHFFDSRTEHVFTKQVKNPRQQRRELMELVAWAVQDQKVLGKAWDFDQAKILFQADHPL